MNILNKIKKKWDFSKSVEQNAIYFNTRENAENKARKKMLFLVLFVLVLATFFHNPLLGFAMMIGAISYGSEAVFNSAETDNISVVSLDSTHFVVAYQDVGNSNYGTAIVGVISGTTITYGSEYVYNSAATPWSSLCKIDSTHFVVAYSDSGNSGSGTSIIGTVASGDEVSYGSEYVFNSASTQYTNLSLLDSTHFVVVYRDVGNDAKGTAVIGTISGTTISYGSEYVFNDAYSVYTKVITIDSTHFIVAYKDDGGADYGITRIGTVSGSNISYGSETTFNAAVTNYISLSLLDSTHFVVVYRDDGNSLYGTAIIGTIDGASITYGSEYVFNSATTHYITVSALDSTHFVVVYYDSGNSGYGTAIIGTVSGSAISYGDEAVFNSGISPWTYVSALDSANFVAVFEDGGNSNYGTGIIGELPSVTTHTKTIQAKARVQQSDIAKTVQAKGRVRQVGVDKTVQAKARVQQTIAKTITSKAKIEATVEQTIQAKATIKQFGVAQTVQSKADIKHPDIEKTIRAKARLKKTPVKTIQSKADIKQTDISKTIQSKADIKKFGVDKTIKAKAAIKHTGITKTATVKARLKQVGIIKTITAKANLWAFRAGYVKMRSRDQEYPITLNSDKDYNKLRSVDQEYPITLKDNRIL